MEGTLAFLFHLLPLQQPMPVTQQGQIGGVVAGVVVAGVVGRARKGDHQDLKVLYGVGPQTGECVVLV